MSSTHKTFNAEDNVFETFIAICYAYDVSYSSVINEMARNYIKTHYEILFNQPGIKEAVGEIDINLNFDKFVKKISSLQICKIKKTKKPKIIKLVKIREKYVRNAAVANVCEVEDVKHEIY